MLAALEALIAKKRAIKQAAMQQLLTGKTRLPGFWGQWETRRPGEIGSTYGGLSGKEKSDFGTGNARYVTFLNVLENVIVKSQFSDRVRVARGERQNLVQCGDVLFNGTSETPSDLALGAVVSEQAESLYLNSFCFGFRIHEKSKYDPLFLAYFFRAPVGRAIMSTLAQGATRYNMSKRQFLSLELLMPAYEEQHAIAGALSDMDQEVAVLEERRDKTHAIKQGMMQQLLTGKVQLVNGQAVERLLAMARARTSDEYLPASCQRKNHWLHELRLRKPDAQVRASKAIVPRRPRDELNVLPRYGGILISDDRWATSYFALQPSGCTEHALCGSHLLRVTSRFVEDAHGHAWATTPEKTPARYLPQRPRAPVTSALDEAACTSACASATAPSSHRPEGNSPHPQTPQRTA